ncbi:MAG: peroxidase [Herpetosiphon sp.]
MADLKTSDIQGLVVSAYIHLQCSAYFLLQIDDPAAARSWLRSLVGTITTAEGKQDHDSLNLAFTHSGLKQLGLDKESLDTFPHAFKDGMASENRARILGDTGDNAPANWRWGGTKNPVDMLLLIYAEQDDQIVADIQRHRDAITRAGGLTIINVLVAGRQPDIHEHFGFADGIGQPVMQGSGRFARQLRRTGHATELQTGEFLLGYPNEYDILSSSPTIGADRDPKGLFESTPDGRHNLGLNGTYLVFRQLAQHVAQFWQFMEQAASVPGTTGDPTASIALASKCVGRWPSGAPLVLTPDRDDPSLGSANDFNYATNDPQGLACPIGSHVRRANPRDALGPDPKTALASARRHRILRRGRSYGDRIANPLTDDGAERGLHFICLNADIERQFEFVQQTWINNPVFAGLNNEVDPLVGDQDNTGGTMTIQHDPVRVRVHNLERFVTVLGGAYFFLPSIPAVRFLAGDPA